MYAHVLQLELYLRSLSMQYDFSPFSFTHSTRIFYDQVTNTSKNISQFNTICNIIRSTVLPAPIFEKKSQEQKNIAAYESIVFFLNRVFELLKSQILPIAKSENILSGENNEKIYVPVFVFALM